MHTSKERDILLQRITNHISAFEARERSRAERNYSEAMEKSAAALAAFTRTASFDEILTVEKSFQQNDLTIYAKRPGTVKSVEESIDDFEAGEAVCRQLLGDTAAYAAHRYRKKEMLAPEYEIPLDAMRRALRGQIKRVENYRVNVMGNDHEQAFLSARIAMLHRAEDMYDRLQKERLLPAE